MNDDPFLPMGLVPVRLEHRPVFQQALAGCRTRLSDYSFAATYIWQDAIRLRWKLIDDSLCVFANGEGLTLLLPPLGAGPPEKALREAVDLCRQFNAERGYPDRTRVEYVSDDILTRLPVDCTATPMSGDYVYSTARMIDLAGGDLASKRHDRNRFARDHAVRTEPYEPRHRDECLKLLALWHHQHEQESECSCDTVREKRTKEEASVIRALLDAPVLALEGMVLYADDRLVGFTFGERLTGDTCSILIEKADRSCTGSAQYIFSEFCRRHFADTSWVNAGDDWEIAALARTKQSYRPAARLGKWTVTLMNPVSVAAPVRPALEMPVPEAPMPDAAPVFDRAAEADLDRLLEIERASFAPEIAFSKRRLKYLMGSPCADVQVIRQDNRVVAQAVLLRQRTPRGAIGRLYSMAVDAACRGQGLGKKLLAQCLDSLKSHGVRTVFLEVDQTNAAAIRLYQSFGFRTVRELANYYGPDCPGWKMRLEMVTIPSDEGTVPSDRKVARGLSPS